MNTSAETLPSFISVRGARRHNLQAIDVDIPLRRLVVITGVSGSGKSSLAVNTLGAAGQRRFWEALSPSLRRRLDRLDPPDADRLAAVPPTVVLRGDAVAIQRDLRSTVSTLLGVEPILAEWFASAAEWRCPDCGLPIAAETTSTVLDWLQERAAGCRALILFAIDPRAESPAKLVAAGFVRAVCSGEILSLPELKRWPTGAEPLIVVDRLEVGTSATVRWQESLNVAFRQGQGRCAVAWEAKRESALPAGASPLHLPSRRLSMRTFSQTPACAPCGRTFPAPQQALFDRHRLEAACPACVRQPAGTTCVVCNGLQVGDAARASRLLSRAWTEWQVSSVHQTLEWMRVAEEVGSKALQQSAVSARSRLVRFEQPLRARLQALVDIGLGHLSLSRPTTTLSPGDVCRVLLSHAVTLPTSDSLFVVDEPCSGAHPTDVQRIVGALRRLQSRRNSVCVVDHHPGVVQAADFVIELGPSAGANGGQVVAAGSPRELIARTDTATVQSWRAQSAPFRARPRRAASSIWRLTGIRHRGLVVPELSWPLGTLGAITGPSGCGKSTLIEALHQAGRAALKKASDAEGRSLAPTVPPGDSPSWSTCAWPHGWTEIVLVNQSPLHRQRRSTVVTWLKVFDEIRQTFAETAESKRRGWTATQFSFLGRDGGRCPICQGLGLRMIDTGMAVNEAVRCTECRGTRFRPEILEARYRGMSINDVLRATAAEAATWFRHLPKVFSRLHGLTELGLGYLVLGQPVTEVSGGEAQRLKLASRLWGRPVGPTVFLCDGPSTGLHPLDVERLVRGLQQLVELGHTVILADHHRAILDAADWIVELAAVSDERRIAVAGTPEALATSSTVTANILRGGQVNA